MPQRIAPARGDAPEARLARLLDSPHLTRVVPHLAPELLHQLIRHRGLDVSEELIAAATPEQLRRVFDLDLWRHSQPGHDEHFDADRFGDWLALLADAADTAFAKTVADADLDLVIGGLSHHIRVFDLAIFEPTAPTDDEATDPGLGESDLTCEVGGYFVAAKRSDAWDAIVTLLVALETEHPQHFHAVMRGCRDLSDSTPETDGLDDLLKVPEQQLHDLAFARERRRSQQGYSTAADGRAFLEMARQRRRDRPAAGRSTNPIAAAYFRAAHEETAAATGDRGRLGQRAATPPEKTADIGPVIDAVVELLAEAGLAPEPPRALLGSGPWSPRLVYIRSLMEHLREADETVWLERNRELAFLANTLVAGCSVQSRAFTPREASDAVVATCNLGLEQWRARSPDAGTGDAASTADPAAALLPDTFLVDHDLVTVFEVGWSTLHEDVGLHTARRLMAILGNVRCPDVSVQDGLSALRHELRRHCEAGTPWRVRDALDVIAILDTAAWIALLGLVDECPVIPEALTAILEGRTETVSATTFELISTGAQIDAVRTFLGRLSDVLRG